MESNSGNNGAEFFSPGDAERCRRLIQAVGARRAAELTGINESTLARLAAGMGVRRASAIVARQAIARIKIDELAR